MAKVNRRKRRSFQIAKKRFNKYKAREKRIYARAKRHAAKWRRKAHTAYKRMLSLRFA